MSLCSLWSQMKIFYMRQWLIKGIWSSINLFLIVLIDELVFTLNLYLMTIKVSHMGQDLWKEINNHLIFYCSINEWAWVHLIF